MKPILAAVIFLLTVLPSFSQQYTINGNADVYQNSCNCYTLTPDRDNQSGSVWNNIKIDLNNSFDYNFDVYLGTNNSPGADGIAFVLQPISTSVGTSGGGMGFQGIVPSIGVTLDTYQNTGDGDPAADHIAIQRNGDLLHNSANNLAGPVPASAGNNNIEDGITHKLRITWNAATKVLTTYFDGVQRVSVTNDLVNTTFGGNPNVFWGFTGATGGEWNEQRFCTALSPEWNFLPAQKRCIGEPIRFMNSTISFAPIIKMYWTFGDGPHIDSVNTNPIHTYTSAGVYPVTQRVIGADGCERTNSQQVIVGSKPIADFSIADNCIKLPTSFEDLSTVAVGTINSYWWDLDDGVFANTQFTSTQYNSIGVKTIRHSVVSLQGCVSDTVEKTVQIRAFPIADFNFTDSLCLGSTFTFNDQSTLVDGPITRWIWYVDGVEYPSNPNPFNYTFTTPGLHTIGLRTSGVLLGGTTPSNYCAGDLVTKNVFVTDKPRAAMKVFRGCEDVNVTLQDSSYTLDGLPVTAWWWDLGNGNFSTQQNPSLVYNDAGPVEIKLVVWNSKGCKSDTLKTSINIFSKPEINFSISDSCIGNNIQFNGFISNGSGNAASWYWYFDNGAATSILQNPSIVYTSAGNKNIQLFAVNINGCAADTLYRPIHIYDKPVVNMNFQDSVCLGSSINFSGLLLSSGDPVTSWQWTFDGTTTASTQNASHTFTTPGVHTVTLNASTTGVASCYGPVVQRSVFIADKPRAAIRSLRACEAVATQLQDSSYTTDGLPVTSWWWDLGNGNFSTQQNPAVTYNNAGIYNIQLVVWNSRGCRSDTLKTAIKIYTSPAVDFTFSEPACGSEMIRFTDISTSDTSIAGWNWSAASGIFSTQQNPVQAFPSGSSQAVNLIVTNAAGCISSQMVHNFLMKTKAGAVMNFDDACKNEAVVFTASEAVTNIGITSWHWNPGDGTGWVQGNPSTHVYTANGNYPVKVYGITTEGCASDTIPGNILIYGTDAFAGNDVLAAANQPIQLTASGGLSYQWTPSTGLSATDIADPVAINNTDRTYYLRAFTPEGCESFDTVTIKIYKGPDIYVPTAFTPNGDGRNDVLKPIAVGITLFDYFAVYNRYGQLVYRSNNPNAGWDGRVKGAEQQTSNFVWMVSGTDFQGKKITRNGTVLLIR